MAAAALKRSDDSRWEAYTELAMTTFATLPRVVGRDNLSAYIANMDPITMLVPLEPTARLEVFPAKVGDDLDEKDALSALNRSYLFVNQEEIEGSFVQIQAHLSSWVQADAQVIPKLIAAADALPVAANAAVTDELRRQAAERVARLRGCPEADLFLPIDRGPDAPCSIAFTEAARGIEGSLKIELDDGE